VVGEVEDSYSKLVSDFRQSEGLLMAHAIRPYKQEREKWLSLLKQKQDEVARLNSTNSHNLLAEQQMKQMQLELREKDAIIQRLVLQNEQLAEKVARQSAVAASMRHRLQSVNDELGVLRDRMAPLREVKQQLSVHSDQMATCALVLGKMAALLSVKDNAIYALQRDLAHARADAGFSRPAQLSQSHAMQEQQFESKDRLLQEMIRNLQSQLRRDSARG
jgi:hypothetical protein